MLLFRMSWHICITLVSPGFWRILSSQNYWYIPWWGRSTGRSVFSVFSRLFSNIAPSTALSSDPCYLPQDANVLLVTLSWLNLQNPGTLHTTTLLFLTFPTDKTTFQWLFWSHSSQQVFKWVVHHHLLSLQTLFTKDCFFKILTNQILCLTIYHAWICSVLWSGPCYKTYSQLSNTKRRGWWAEVENKVTFWGNVD